MRRIALLILNLALLTVLTAPIVSGCYPNKVTDGVSRFWPRADWPLVPVEIVRGASEGRAK